MPLSSFPQLCGVDFFPVPAMPLSVFRMEDGPINRHSHDFYEIILVARGTARHEVFPPESETGQIVHMVEGDVFLIPVGWSHGYDEGTRLVIFNLLFAPQLLEQWPYNQTTFGSSGSIVKDFSRWHLQQGERQYLESLLQGITRELTGRSSNFEVAVRAKLAEALVWLDRLHNQPPGQRAPESKRAVSQAIAFMEQHFAEDIVLKDIARAAHLSTHYFCEVFKSSTGLSPGRYLSRLRLEHARYLLLTTIHPVTKVAHAAGFADASYFARAFKTEFGTSPSQLRTSGR